MATISLYRLIDTECLLEAGLKIEPPIIQYDLGDDMIDIQVPDQYFYLNMNDLDKTWTPELHNLTISQIFKFNNYKRFYGVESITQEGNTIGIAAHIFSRDSSFQTTIPLTFFRNEENEYQYSLRYDFPENSLKGKIQVEYFMFLQELNNHGDYQADIVGSRLTEQVILSYTIAVDGSGSMFPIVDINEPGDPLWAIETNWNDPLEESFNSSFLSLRLNQAHPRYNNLVSAKGKVDAYLMNEILSSSMSIITQSILFGEEPITLEELRDNSMDDSIGKVVYYWIDNFNIEINSPATISNSFHKYLESMNLS